MIRISTDLSTQITSAIKAAQAVSDLPAFDIPAPPPVTRAKNPDHGDYATPVAMQLARLARMKPDAIAEIIVKHFPADASYIGAVERAGGFINFRLSDGWLQQQIEVILAEGASFGSSDAFAGKRAQVECVSANPTGPITVGRIRGGVIGDTLGRMLTTLGYDVEMEYYFNNAGRQMRKLGESLKARYIATITGEEANLPEGGYQGEYLIEMAQTLYEQDGEQHIDKPWEFFKAHAEAAIFEMIKVSLDRVGIRFDTFFNENSLYEDGSVWDTLDRLKEAGLVYEALQAERDDDHGRPAENEAEENSDGANHATWIRMRKLRDVSIDKALVKASGEPTYRLPDTAYHINKLERGFDVAINVLGSDHIEEAKDVAAMVAALGYDADKINVILHQFVTLVENDEVKRMSTRRGDFVTLDELVDDVGPDAVRYFILARSPNSEITFDLDLARKQSNENPVYYIQNAHVRCASMARVAEERGIHGSDGDVSLLTESAELTLIRRLIELPEIIDTCVDTSEPHRLAFWAHEELARTFHPIYDEVRALHSDVPEDIAKARLKLYAAAQTVIKRTLDLMGMTAPEQM